MTQIDVVYTPTGDIPSAPGVALLSHLRAIVSEELAVGWAIVSSEPIPDTVGSWLVTLQSQTADSALDIKESLLAAADPQLRLFLDIPNLSANAGTSIPADPEAPSIRPFTLPLPPTIPAVLLGSEAKQRSRAALQGVLTGFLLSLALGLFTPPASTVRRMFDPRTPSAAVPIAILCLFFWGILYGLNRRRRLLATETLNGADLLPAVINGLHTHGVELLEQALRGQDDDYKVVQYSPLLRRVWVTLEQWLIRPSLQNAHLVIEQQVISDRESTQRAYNLLRIFVWATPVLGLIGTVVGISIAVGGFASFLSTNVDDVSKIKAGLVGVTGGLSFAFLITLEGLLSSLILMLFTSNIQTQEERLYAEIERSVTEKFLPELQRASPEREPGAIHHAPAAWAHAMSDASRKVIRAVEIAGKRILTRWEESHDTYIADLTETRDSADRSSQLFAAALEKAATNIAALGQVSAQVLESHAALRTAMTQTPDAGLTQVLANLDTSLQDLKPLLDELRHQRGTPK